MNKQKQLKVSINNDNDDSIHFKLFNTVLVVLV